MTDALFKIEPISFRVATPDSKKNRGNIVRYGNRFSYRPNPVALAQEERIREFLTYELWGECPQFGDRDVRVTIRHYAREDECEVVVEDLGPRRKGFSGRRRDLSNVSEVLLDAMQGPVYENDNQVCELHMARVI